jgi:DegV family protein with EDD domain
MPKVAIVTDSTAYIPAELLRSYDVKVVPLQVIWGEQTFRDNVDITPAEFYDRLPKVKAHPTTSQPSPAAFKDIYEPLLAEGFDILSVHISAKLSGTIDSATQAKQLLPGAAIEIVDSMSTSLCLGFPVLAAARAAAQGSSLAECKAIAEQGIKNTGVLFAVNTLEYLRKGGRIGGAQAFLGTALNLKPILEVRDGRIEAVERVRTMNKAIDRLLELAAERIGSRRPISLAVVHAAAPEAADALLARLRTLYSVSDVSEAVISPVSPTLGVHVGPGTLGIAFMAGM